MHRINKIIRFSGSLCACLGLPENSCGLGALLKHGFQAAYFSGSLCPGKEAT
ncbi:hypothetical protein H9Q10_00500 [Eikenella sp. S3360]|uniref:Uncharacterized protein n=1 Tax=Eikenella glucosivorans TaxID=2766967 RepID=A0ABS0N7B3_9NEIS|nr:hypothetical protein [Eikenella glucosivorans]MBH5328156.1 hypothetical protein [Eikenella glucosivorans]